MYELEGGGGCLLLCLALAAHPHTTTPTIPCLHLLPPPLLPLPSSSWPGVASPPQPARPRSRLLRLLGRGFADPPNMPAAGQRHRLANFNSSDSTRLKLANSRSHPPRFKLPTKWFIGKSLKCKHKNQDHRIGLTLSMVRMGIKYDGH